ncbi:class I SAM-dependent methyltransferase [Pontibacter sp. HSC-14F20]|uniref:class I SAM-dependent methyltransferase n=1 Tax=Pontibacter sp. HSC-14F20 TaxID=2864136 RepID=UPI001C73626A|nr:class I SAM-dependent methyltransferase [Pontibacter sp. HSC-14F20]MBX0333436.1 class I SAM-dependent methyltransferase [Pontibacter sp. HSC-14F20]
MLKLIFKALEILFVPITILLAPITIISAAWMKFLTTFGIHKAALAEKIFTVFGVLPIRDHYYQPLVNPKKHLKKSLHEDRYLPGINFNDNIQLKILQSFNYNQELLQIPIEKPENNNIRFYFSNGSYESGDAEYLYNMIRQFRPNRMIEIGSGFSTLMAIEAFRKNKELDKTYEYEHICIEPYEMPWLESTTAKIIRQKVESLDINIFKKLNKNDILFIDSSHIIRPQGDVLFEILEILPNLNPGVLVHIHDIFTPKDYLEEWVYKEHLLWNEQYLLEAFLSNNDSYEIVGAVNYLLHNHKEDLYMKAPILAKQSHQKPGSFWIRKKLTHRHTQTTNT